uniref:FAM184 domain-containing protein n=1 Tax=Toxocara canis TaxID=6265 RepID=A0A183URU5_TOXCA
LLIATAKRYVRCFSVESPSQQTVIRDSRPDITAWPTPPNAHNKNGSHLDSASCDEPAKLINMIKVAAASTGAPRGRETELKKKIQTLEDTVAEYERQKYNVMGTFSEYRERVAERERKLEAEYSSKIIALSEEVLGAKKDFEARMKSFQALQASKMSAFANLYLSYLANCSSPILIRVQYKSVLSLKDKFEREKEQALEKLRQEHQKEIQLLEQRFSESQLLNLEQKYMIEIQRLEEERKSLKAEKERLGETFEMKLRRAQSLYETELTAAKMLYSKELEALRDHEEALKDELLARQDEFHDRLQELQHQSKRRREELATCKNEVTALEKRLQAKEAELLAISKELEEARNETNDSLRKLSKVESELQQTKQQYREQEEELQRKSNLLNIVETAKSKLEAVIRDLQTEVKALKNKVEFLEKERENLQSQSESQTQLQNSQVHALEAVLESVTKEKESTKEHYEGLLDRERQQAEEREYAMKKEFSAKLNELEEQYNNLKEQLEQNAKRDKEELQDVSQISGANAADDDLSKLIDKTDELKAELEKSKQNVLEKELQINELKKQVEQENELNDDQLSVIRDEIRNEIMNSSDFKHNEGELKGLRGKINTLEAEKKAEQMEREKMCELAKQLKTENEQLKEQLKDLNEKTESEASASEDSERASSYCLQIERLMSDLNEREKRIDQMEATQQRTKGCESRKKYWQLEMLKAYNPVQNKKLGEEIVFLKEDSKAKSQQIEDLHSRVKSLLHEVSTIKAELDKKNIEIKNFSRKTDEYLRYPRTRRDNQQAQVLERKIINLNKEHEKTIDLMKEHEMELAAKLKKLQDEMKNGPKLVSSGMQTDDLPQSKEENRQYSTQEQQTEPNVEELSTKLEELGNALKVARDEVIAHLQEELFNESCCEGSEHEGKKNRSQSVATGEHMAMCQRAASKFQNLVSQMTEKKEKGKLKNVDKANVEEELSDCAEVARNKRDKEKEKKGKEKEREKKEKDKDKEKEKAGLSSGMIHRAKSPSLLTRLRDRSPAKAKSPSVELKLNSEKKHHLSPADAERSLVVEDRRRTSPSRQFFSRSKRDSAAQSTAVLSPALSKEDSAKRPAWKF